MLQQFLHCEKTNHDLLGCDLAKTMFLVYSYFTSMRYKLLLKSMFVKPQRGHSL